MRRSGYADLPLHYGKVPPWLYDRMKQLGGAIVEAIIADYGTSQVLQKISDPHWFQAFGAVLGMDWHSSGITTSVMGSLKQAINPRSKELGIYICGGRGKHSLKTPDELRDYGQKTGINSDSLVTASKLSAKIDNTAIQDGFQLYLHSFIVSKDGEWSVVQQGMNTGNRYARRYHWHSGSLTSFVEEPHTSVCGKNLGQILNLVHKDAGITRKGILEIAKENPSLMLNEIKRIKLPVHHKVKESDFDIKRLGAILALAQETDIENFEDLLILKGLGPKTLRSLTLISEVIHGTPSRFEDPARFSFAHGGKDGHPYPVLTKIYDESIGILKCSIDRARIDFSEKRKALKKLSEISEQYEKNFNPQPGGYKKFLQDENENAWKYGGKTVFGDSKKTGNKRNGPIQLKLF